MKTPSSRPDQTLFLNLTMAVVLLPFFAGLAAIVHLTGRAQVLWSGSATLWEQCVVYTFAFAVPLIALVLILWKGWSRGPLVLLALSFFVLGFQRLGYSPNSPKRVDLAFGRSGQAGIDVFCNGEHLGKTPFRISDEEFHRKVSPWTKPPRQDRLVPSESGLEWTRFTWVPNDVISDQNQWPPPASLSCLSDEKKKLEAIKTCPYWWRFESNGHRALCTICNFGGGSSGTMGRVEVNVTPSLTFPALQPHLALVIDGLLAQKDPPSPAWIAHFRKYQNLLFLPFFEKAKSDPRLRKALDAVARAEYDVPVNPTPADCERALAAILDRVEAHGFFQIPSIESIALDLLGSAAAESVVRHYGIEASGRISDTGRLGGGGDSYVVHYRTGKAVRLFPLEYAVKKLRPPELFDLLVYRWARTGEGLDLVACYENQKAVDLVAEYLRDSGRDSGRRHDRALPKVVGILNPALQEHLQNFVRENGGGAFNHYYVTQFVKSRIGVPGINQAELAAWVYHWAPLDERGKQDLLARINSPCVATFLNIMRPMRDEMKWSNVLYILAENQNPSLAQVLIDAYLAVKEPANVVYECTSLVKAIVRTDTPAVHKFFETQWQEQTSRAKLLERLAVQDKADLARLAWLTPLMKKVTDPASKTKAAKLLASFRTPEADKLLDRWATEGNDEVRKAIQRQREERKEEDAAHAGRLQQWSDLLAGKIQPEDLLPPQKPWHWDGTQYIQQKQ
jgi:hypothetical protein